MRGVLAALTSAAMVTVPGVGGAVSPAQGCQRLRVARSSYDKRNGSCFRTARAVGYFGNGGWLHHGHECGAAALRRARSHCPDRRAGTRARLPELTDWNDEFCNKRS